MNTLPLAHRRVTRRELLNYVWMASMALLLAKAGSTAWMFALPRQPLAQTDLPVDALPAVNVEPMLLHVLVSIDVTRIASQTSGGDVAPTNHRIVVVNTPTGIHAFLNRCTHHGCTPVWTEAQQMFACPCYGSQFTRGGAYIAGPAPRALDRFPIIAKDAHGDEIAQSQADGLLVLPANAARITIDYSTLILGKRHF